MSMNTSNGQPPITPEVRYSIGREIISVLNSCTINISIEQTLQELQLAVERFTFGSHGSSRDMTMNDVDMLLRGDVSLDMMSFIEWLHHRKLLRLLIGKNGRLLLSFCTRYYRSVPQVKCSTPIPLRESFRIKLLTQLRMVYPEPTRIVFETVPSLMAGCVIDDGIKSADMSLQSKTPQYVRQYVAALQRMRSAQHG